ncbi:MAG: GFA family protein, partial [Pseudomonadota bacterium]
MIDSNEWTGQCLCGAVTYSARARPIWAAFCHCGMCRKVSGAPYLSFVQFPVESVEWNGAEPKRYVSSPGIKRAFCGDCGSTLTFEVHDKDEQ